MSTPAQDADLEIRAEGPKDYDAVHRLHEAASASPEAALVDALRAAGDHVPGLCLVAVDGEGSVVGHVFFSEARLDSGAAVLALAPMGVLPDRQRRSIGSALVRESLRRAAGHPIRSSWCWDTRGTTRGSASSRAMSAGWSARTTCRPRRGWSFACPPIGRTPAGASDLAAFGSV